MTSKYSDPGVNISLKVFHLYTQKLLSRFHEGGKLGFPHVDPGAECPTVKVPELKPKPVKDVAIVGAGVAGLYAAMLLKEKNHEFNVHIYEASERIGGRLYTHRFENKSAINTPAKAGEYDYFDVGAMRFPETPVMEKTYELFRMLKIPLLPYNISNEANWMCYNGVRKQKAGMANAWAGDPFRVSKKNKGNVPDEYACQDPSALLEKEIAPFIKKLVENPDTALDELIDHYDHYSTRSYLTSKGYPPAVVNWIETMSYGTGWFDRALIETILEQLAFSYDRPSSTDLKWRCVKGGSEMIPMKMVEWLQTNAKKTTIHTRHRVVAVDYKDGKLTVSGISHPLQTGDPASFRDTYDQVIFAIPPPCLRMIDLDTCELDYDQRSAIRQLQLAPSSKIGMKFKTAWWAGVNQDIVGGQSTTDRTARTIVYPSHGSGESTVLIASYTWTQDSSMLGAMMHGPGSAEEERLKQIILKDLAIVHDLPLKTLLDEFEYMYAFDWSHNPYAMGGFGLFGPSQFREFYRHVTRPAARGQIHFIGETFSSTHGWVAGALESAERGICQLLQYHQRAVELEGARDGMNVLEAFLKEWNPALEVDKNTLWLQFLASQLLQREEFDKTA